MYKTIEKAISIMMSLMIVFTMSVQFLGNMTSYAASDEQNDKTEKKKVEKTISLNCQNKDLKVEVTADKKANLNNDTKIKAKKINDSEKYYKEAIKALNKKTNKSIGLKNANFYDISLFENGQEIEPSDEVDVKLSFLNSFNAKNKENLYIAHFTEKEGKIQTEILKDVEYKTQNKELKETSFKTDSFSVYGVIYTVDFDYKGKTFNLKGGNNILLSDVFEKLNIKENISDVEDVYFSDLNLLKIDKVNNDWKLSSLKPFNTTEMLTIVFSNKNINIAVTDSQYICKITDDNGEHPFETLNEAMNFARSTNISPKMDANNQVKIEMLTDYIIPSKANTGSSDYITPGTSDDDRIVLENNDDNICITTAATSGCDYTFTPTFDETQGRLSTDSEETAILSRGWEPGSGNQEQAVAHNNGLLNIKANSGKLTTNNIILDGTGSFKGRAMVINSGSIFINEDTQFRNFKSEGNGGAIYSAVALSIGEKDGHSVTFSNCSSISYYNGGAIYSNSTTDILNCTFSDCSAANSGGAIYANTTSNITNCSFLNCSSKNNGGAINANSNTTITDCTYENCIAKNGGGVFSNNSILSTNCNFEGCTASQYGGSVYASALSFINDTNKEIGFYNSTATSNQGGAIYISNNSGNVLIKNTEGGKIVFDKCKSLNQEGGAIYSKSKIIINNEESNIIFKDCTATKGGAINTEDYLLLKNTLKTQFINCSAENGDGGAIFVNEKLIIEGEKNSNVEFDSCKAPLGKGGAIYQNGKNELTLSHIDIHDGLAKKGGAIYTKTLKLNLKDKINITENIVDSTDCNDAGGIYTEEENKIDIGNNRCYSHTPNVNSDGVQNGLYGNNIITNDVITIPNATSLKVDIYYKCESSSDWVSVWKGIHPEYSAYYNTLSNDCVTTAEGAPNNKNQLSGSGSETYIANGNKLVNMGHCTLIIPNDSVTIGFRSDYSITNYGYYAIITGLDENNEEVINNENIVINNNTTSDGKSSNVKTGNINPKFNIETNHLTGTIGVTNPQKGCFANSSVDKVCGEPTVDHGDYGKEVEVFKDDTNSYFAKYGKSNMHRLYWAPTQDTAVCKITDEDGNLLYYGEDDDGNLKPAVFYSLEDAFEACEDSTGIISGLIDDFTDENGNEAVPANIEMLVESYNQESIIKIPNMKLTLKTAKKGEGQYDYKGNSDKCTITKNGFNNSMYIIDSEEEFTLKDITIDGNGISANSNGGIIRVEDLCQKNGSLRLINTVILNSSTSNLGGAIYLNNNISLEMNNSRIENCSSEINGGGIYLSGNESVIVENSTFKDCEVTSNDTNNNINSGCGGAIFCSRNNAVFRECNFENNKVIKRGGGICFSGTGTLKIYGGEFNNCKATYETEKDGMGFGGAIYLDKGNLIIDKNNNNRCKFENCYGGRFGGAILARGDSSYTNTIENTDFINCTVKLGRGGAYETDTSLKSITFNDCTFNSCKSGTGSNGGKGGAIDVFNDSNIITLNRCIIKKCESINNGSALFAKCNITIKDSIITENKVQNNNTEGGAVSIIDNTPSKKIELQGNTKIINNIWNEKQCNVYINADSDKIVNASNLLEEAEIGIYISDNYIGKYGKAGRTFGSYTGNPNNLDKLINDREKTSNNEEIRGMHYVKNKICWQGEPIILHVKDINDDTPISDTCFELLNNGSEKIWSGITDEEGNVSIPLNIYCSFEYNETYKLKETKAKEGYALPGGYWKIEIEATTGLKITTKHQSGNNYISNIEKENEQRWVITNTSGNILVHYNLEGGEWNENNEQLFTFNNEKMTSNEHIPETIPTKESYIFGGWSDNSNGTGAINYCSNDNLSKYNENEITLHAVWLDPSYVARVIDKEGNITYHEYLITTSGKEGAFNKANTLTGNVCIELLKETSDRYSLESKFIFNKTDLNITLKTKSGIGFKSKIKKNLSNTVIEITNKVKNITVEDIDFDGNSTSINGNQNGGIFNIASLNASFKDCSFKDCNINGSYRGGALYYSNNDGLCEIYGCKFDNCKCSDGSSAANGGGAAIYSGAAIIDESDKNRTEFVNCYANRYGGGLSCESPSKKIILNNTDFKNCTANNNNGGGFETDSTDLEMSNCTFDNCKSNLGNAGGVNQYNGSDTIVSKIKNTTFTNCSAKNNGGGINTPSNAIIHNCTFDNCSSENNGGGIKGAYGRSITVVKSNFVNCSSKVNGGGIESGILKVENSSFDNCSSISSSGGGICATNSSNITDSSFKNCISAKDGGGIYCSSDLTIENGHFENCHAGTINEVGAVVTSGNGGAIYNNKLIVKNTSFGVKNDYSKGCSATNAGGAIYSNNLTYENNSNSEKGFYYCKAIEGEGGAIFVTYVNRNNYIVINNSTPDSKINFENCTAKGNGGGISVDSNGMTINNKGKINFSQCTTERNGGGICTDNNNIYISNTKNSSMKFENCKADNLTNQTANGGGIAAIPVFEDDDNKGEFIFKNCEAKDLGGGIYLFNNNPFNINNMTIENCKANNGGGIYIYYINSVIKNSVIKANEATKGGAIYYYGNKNLYLDSVNIKNNRATDINGGAINNDTANAKIYFQGDSVIYDNISDGIQKNMILEYNNTEMIRMDENGLGENARVGVYVTDNVFSKRGERFKIFGTYEGNTENADKFVNDRNLLVGESTGTKDIGWSVGYKLILNPNGGDGEPISVNLGYFKEYSLKNPYTKEGYKFDSWNTRKDGTGKKYYASDIVSELTEEEGSTITLYAQWENTQRHYIHFHPTGGKDIPSREVKDGDKIGLLPTTTRDGYTFLKWKYMKNGIEQSFSKDTIVKEDIELYAVWQKNITITFNTAGGIVGEETREMLPGKIGSLPKAERGNYIFDGWYDEEGNKVENDTVFEKDEIITAHWKIRLNYNSNGGMPNKDLYEDWVTNGLNYTIQNIPTVQNHGYQLDGWYNKPEGGEKYEQGEEINLEENNVLYAHWTKQEEVTVTFDSNGGSNCSAITLFKGDYIHNYPKPTKSGYIFKGWYNNDNQEINNLSIINEDITVTAKWEEKEPEDPTPPEPEIEKVDLTFNGNGLDKTTTISAFKGKKLQNIPGMYRVGYILEGWYENEEGTGEKLTTNTIITEEKTYYAKWKIAEEEINENGLNYQYSIKWITESEDGTNNVNDHIYYQDVANPIAKLHISFLLKEQDGITLPEGAIKIHVPKQVFENKNGNGMGTNDITNMIPPYPQKRAGFLFSYIDGGDEYILINNDIATGGAGFDLKVTYNSNSSGNVYPKCRYISSKTGEIINEQTDVVNDDGYEPKRNHVSISVDKNADNISDVVTEKDLYTHVLRTLNPINYKVSYSKPQSENIGVYKNWNTEWGNIPEDDEECFYVKWPHGYQYGNAVDTERFTTTSKEWLPDRYEKAYENDNYSITKHKYSDLTNAQITLYRNEKIIGSWKSGEERIDEGTLTKEVDFRVSEPYSKTKVTELNGGKSHGPIQRNKGGQDILLDDNYMTDYFKLSMSGPGEENLTKKEDTGIYYANPYTMIMRDGDFGDVTYTSSRIDDRRIKLGDNDYSFTELGIYLNNSDGYKDEEGWHELENTAYSSWQPVEIWIRKKGETEYTKYTDVKASTERKTIKLPDDTVGYEARYNTSYWSSKLEVSPTIIINPTEHVKSFIQKDYSEKINSYFYNKAEFKAIKEDGTELLSKESESSFYADKSKTGLRVSKYTGAAINNILNATQEVPITTTAYNYNNLDMTKGIWTGSFYELIPAGTVVDESTVYVNAKGRVPRNQVNVKYVNNWKNTKQTMMIVSVGLPKSIKTSRLELNYKLKNTYENIFDTGSHLYIPSAFVNTTIPAEPYEIEKVSKLNTITNGETLYQELEDEYKENVAYAATTTNYLDINAFAWGFNTSVSSLNTYESQEEILPNSEYTYRLSYSQSEIAISDNLVFYDILDAGTTEETSGWQGELLEVDISKIKEIESYTDKEKCNPIIYYSTKDRSTFTEESYDLSDKTIWTTTKPTSGITAIAVDCSKTVANTDFTMRGEEIMNLYIKMKSPKSSENVGKTAINEAFTYARTYTTHDEIPTALTKKKGKTELLMKDMTPEISLETEPTSGTEEEPCLVAYNDTINYDFVIKNNDDKFTYKDIVIEDILPNSLLLEKNDIYIYTDNKEDAVEIGNSSRVTKEIEGDKITFRLHELLPNETLHIVIPCIVNTKNGVIENKVNLVSTNDCEKEIETNVTYHEVKTYPIHLDKKVLGTNEYLEGSIMQLLDSGNEVIDEWTTTETTHLAMLGAGEYKLREINELNNYSKEQDVHFEITKAGQLIAPPANTNMIDTVTMYNKYIAVDTIVTSKVTGSRDDPNKDFEYVATFSNLKPEQTYTAIKGDEKIIFSSDTNGAAVIEFTLKNDEEVLFKELPSGSKMNITQKATDYDISYNIERDSQIIDSGETNLKKQAITTKDIELDIDKGPAKITFSSTLGEPNLTNVYFIVKSEKTGNPIKGANLNIKNDNEDIVKEWESVEDYKVIGLEKGKTYTLNEISVPLPNIPSETITLSVSEEGILTSNTENIISGNKDEGYVVTLNNSEYIEVLVNNYGKDTDYFATGAVLNLKENLETIKTWTSQEESEILYLEPNKTYTINKVSPARGYTLGDITSYTIHTTNEGISANPSITNNIITFYDIPREIPPLPTGVDKVSKMLLFLICFTTIILLLLKRKYCLLNK